MTRTLRLAALASVATAALWLYAAASRWRDLHLAASTRIAELERLLAWERQQCAEADETAGALLRELAGVRVTMADLVATHGDEIAALEVALRIAHQDAATATAITRQALCGIGDRIDALTSEVRQRRVDRDLVRESDLPESADCDDERTVDHG